MTASNLIAPRLIVGLGNPGRDYEETRHNAGFWFCARLAQSWGVQLAHESRFHGIVGRHGVVWMLLPQTFMNRSGQAVGALARFHRIDPAEILVVHDELDLAPGTVRLKFGGGPGGHNGISDVTAQLGTPDFLRLRIGIGRPASSAQTVSYVLKRAPAAEQLLIDAAIEDALGHIADIVHGQTQKAMNALHTHAR
jgi:PTH1 family peptidyl-tRNA hydrolase